METSPSENPKTKPIPPPPPLPLPTSLGEKLPTIPASPASGASTDVGAVVAAAPAVLLLAELAGWKVGLRRVGGSGGDGDGGGDGGGTGGVSPAGKQFTWPEMLPPPPGTTADILATLRRLIELRDTGAGADADVKGAVPPPQADSASAAELAAAERHVAALQADLARSQAAVASLKKGEKKVASMQQEIELLKSGLGPEGNATLDLMNQVSMLQSQLQSNGINPIEEFVSLDEAKLKLVQMIFATIAALNHERGKEIIGPILQQLKIENLLHILSHVIATHVKIKNTKLEKPGPPSDPLTLEAFYNVMHLRPDLRHLAMCSGALKEQEMPKRFAVGTYVLVKFSGEWVDGLVIKHNYHEKAWPPERIAAYQIRLLADDNLIFCPLDVDHAIKAHGNQSAAASKDKKSAAAAMEAVQAGKVEEVESVD